jgi:hypothetical protein
LTTADLKVDPMRRIITATALGALSLLAVVLAVA